MNVRFYRSGDVSKALPGVTILTRVLTEVPRVGDIVKLTVPATPTGAYFKVVSVVWNLQTTTTAPLFDVEILVAPHV